MELFRGEGVTHSTTTKAVACCERPLVRHRLLPCIVEVLEFDRDIEGEDRTLECGHELGAAVACIYV